MCRLITVKGGTCEPPGLIAARLSIVSMINTIDITVIVLIAPARQNAGSSKPISVPSRHRAAENIKRRPCHCISLLRAFGRHLLRAVETRKTIWILGTNLRTGRCGTGFLARRVAYTAGIMCSSTRRNPELWPEVGDGM